VFGVTQALVLVATTQTGCTLVKKLKVKPSGYKSVAPSLVGSHRVSELELKPLRNTPKYAKILFFFKKNDQANGYYSVV